MTQRDVVNGDGYYEYNVKVHSRKTIRVQTKTLLHWYGGLKHVVIGHYHIMILNGWAVGGFTDFHNKQCVGVLLHKEKNLDPYQLKRIVTKEPMMVERSGYKWVGPEMVDMIIFICTL